MLNSIYKLLIWLVLLLGLVASGAASYWMKLDIEAREYQRFVSDCEEIQLKIAARLKAHEQTLLGGAAMFDASQKVTRQDWHTYVTHLRFNQHFNGIQGLGFSLWIPAAQLSAHEASIRAEGFADYKVRPEGQREAYTSIIFLEPFEERNLRAFGYDMFSEPVRHAAMVRACDENIVTLSGGVRLMQETDKNIQAGTLMYVPVYQQNKPIETVEQRRAALIGWVYSPFRMSDLFNNIVSSSQDNKINQIRLRVYDGENAQVEHLLYDSNPAYAELEAIRPLPLLEITNNFNGTLWKLQFQQIIGTDGLDYSKAWITLSTGVSISILLFLLANSYLNTRTKAFKMAAVLTEQLQESESRFRLLADSAPVLIWLAGVDKLCYQFNKVWLDFTGRTLAQEYGNGWAEGVHSDDLQHCLNIYISSFDARKPFTMEYRLKRYDGEYRWLLDNGMPRFADDGVFLGYIGSCIDITERKHVEAELRISENKFRLLVENIPLALGLADNIKSLIYINDRFKQLFGYSLEDISSVEHWYLLAYPNENYRREVRALWDAVVEQAIENDTDIEPLEYKVTCKNGEERVIVISGIFLADGVILTFLDVTQRKQLEEQLRNISLYTRSLIEASLDPLVTINANGKITDVNEATEKATGFTREQLIQTDFSDYFTDPELASVGYLETFYKGQVTDYPLVIKHRDGYLIDVLFNAVVYRNERGEIAGVFAAARDITERKLIEDKLRINEARYALVLNQAELGTWDWDINSGQVRFNEHWAKMRGYALAEIIQHISTWKAGVHPDDVSSVQTLLTEHFENKTSLFQAEYRVRHHLGHWFWILDRGAVSERDAEGKPLRMVGTEIDITERKQAELARWASEEQLRAFYQLDLVGLAITSPEKGWIRVNHCLCKMLEYSESELRQLTWVELTHPDDLNVDVEQFEKLLANEINGYALEKRYISRTGKIITARLVVRCARKVNGELDYVMAMVDDITEYKKAEAELRIAATVFESQEGMLITDANQIILSANQAFTRITGYRADEVIGQTPRVLYSGRHDTVFYEEMWQSLYDTGVWQGEIWNRRKNGDIYPEWLTITAVKGDNDRITHYVSTMADISERKATEEYIHRLAFYDTLTQLPNRRLLYERIKHGIERYHRTGSEMAVLMMDLDKFKAVNDSLGHAAGDELLQQVAKRIKTRLREVDMVARLGGDEFVILIEDVKHYEHLALIANSIIHTLSQVFTLSEERNVYIGASIGIAIYPQHGDSTEAIIDNADIALYHAKAKGRGCFVYFSEALVQKIKERAILETRLRHAIEQQELHVFFQPQIDINTAQIVGAEALVLWYQPTNGYFMPSEFITLAEETGLILDIGEWLLRETCRLGRQWLDQGLLTGTLSVNVSPYQFRHCNVSALVTKILNETGFPADYLALEITEAGLMDNQENTQPILNELHTQGIHLVIDDFGKGYSSLAYLKHFPLDILKIDNTFIEDLPFSPDDCAITSSIIAMGHHLGFKVLAEGVESVPQLTFLRQQGCDQYQSVHSEALPVSEFEKLLKQHLS